ncbi:MAG: hypothetical protein A3F73_01965 [Gallionellales bacterium RIFCSPLOWO2_12_FULL_59_22]|nr:MAG: hypothetical protein A3H99_04820 [Gallionellales bacterium RIFCSPLOWO2_02_FULL_59_110]OGT04906.1 MAG: hypothetical protein A2Z65_06735 [Gallionellales bacterium RIFCSPLOWO2_02_58_13]OGT13887.1 MAG: hypothetical protein A3F73_01965 [Gallionellales bacterium RIFCSPLOWO2_12_FULL_59_22]
MLELRDALRAWGTPGFEAALKQELAWHAEQLPLLQGLSAGNYVADGTITVTINSVAELDNAIRVMAGIFYRSVTGGCSCAGDPATASENPEYCEVQLDIGKTSAATAVTLATGAAD